MDCIFCKIIKGDIPSYTIYENDYVKCFLDVNPLGKGHTLIVPKKHFKDLFDIDTDYLKEINLASIIVSNAINKAFKPNGIKLVQNNGTLQEVKHYHLHIIPTYSKANNMSIDEVYNELKRIVK